MAGQQRVVNPGPEDPSLLKLQSRHISQAVWLRGVNRILKPRRVLHEDRLRPPSQQIVPYLIQSGFYGASRIAQFEYDLALVSALVERWRPETHTFHTPRGECTITLEDVAVQLGLPCNGQPVCGPTNIQWPELCENLLGIRPPRQKMKGQRLSISWLAEHFDEIPEDADDETIQQHARAYILRLLGGYLMPDRSGRLVYLMYLQLLTDFDEAGRFSWGSAVLAHLYRELCNATSPSEKGIGGCLTLLHMWAWDRFPFLSIQRPPMPDLEIEEYDVLPPLGYRWKGATHDHARPSVETLCRYRSHLDKMRDNEIIWQPYQAQAVRNLIPDYCLTSPEIWRAVVPLICFHIIEWHQPDRVLRQFGMQQPIPRPPVDLEACHTIQLQGKTDMNWIQVHQNHILTWFGWQNEVAHAPMAQGPMSHNSAYMQWYWRHTRRWIQKTSAAAGYSADLAEEIHRLSLEHPISRENQQIINNDSRNLLLALGEQRFSMDFELAPPATEFSRPQIPEGRPGKRRQGFISLREPIVENEREHDDSEHDDDDDDDDEDDGGGNHDGIGAASSSTPIVTGPSSSYAPTTTQEYFGMAGPSSFMPEGQFRNFENDVPSYYMPSSPMTQFGSPNASLFTMTQNMASSQFGSFSELLSDSSAFNAAYSGQWLQPGHSSNQGLVTPHQPIPPTQSPGLDLNSSPIAGMNYPQQEEQEQEQEQLGHGRARRTRRPTRCGTGSHFFGQ